MKKTNRLLSLVLVFALLFSTVNFALSIDNLNNTYISVETIIENMNLYIPNVLQEDNEIVSYIPMYDTENQVVAYCFFLLPCGYIITDLNGSIVEANFEHSRNYDLLQEASSQTIYYSGPYSYYTLDNSGLLCDLMTDNLISAEYVQEDIDEFSEKSNSTIIDNYSAMTASARSISFRYDLVNSLRTIEYNPNGVCASTAAAIVLYYYDDYKNSNAITNEFQDSTGESLIVYLSTLINGIPPQSATVRQIRNGLLMYFAEQQLSNVYSATYSGVYIDTTSSTTINQTISDEFSLFVSLIQNDNPIIVLFNAGIGETYDEHFLVIHGLLQDVSGGEYYAYLNDGWGSNNVMLNLKYLNSYAYITEL